MLYLTHVGPQSERDLFDQLRRGDKEALSTLYQKYFPLLMHYGIRIVPDKYIVEESIQDMFIYIYESKEKLGQVKYVKPYLFRALRRRVLEKISAERKVLEREAEMTTRTNIQFSAEDILFAVESKRNQKQALVQILNNLPWRQREAVYLRYYNGLNTKEIAEIMGVANQTVLNTLYHALKKIRGIVNLKEILE